MDTYVTGFMFSTDIERVLLLRKDCPEWQRGLLNGLGGKVEADEEPSDAMVREFQEECGLETEPGDWTPAAILDFEDRKVYIFRATGPLQFAASMYPGEPVEVVNVADLPNRAIVPNLRWLIPLCAHFEYGVPVYVQEAA